MRYIAHAATAAAAGYRLACLVSSDTTLRNLKMLLELNAAYQEAPGMVVRHVIDV
jgi:hypothetical protein